MTCVERAATKNLHVPDNDDHRSVLTLVLNDGKYSGKFEPESGETTELDKVSFDGKEFELSIPFERDGNNGVLGVEATLKKDGSLSGEWFLKGEDGQEWVRESWKATRK